jgi:hypothetical protein
LIRLAAMLFVLLATRLAAASEPNAVLLLIEPLAAGPAAPPESYVHDVWVRWPASEGATENRLLSVVTSADWRGAPQDYAFRNHRQNVWRAENREAMIARGYFRAKRENLRSGTAALAIGPGVSERVLLLAVEEAGRVEPVPLASPWPKGRLMIGQARNWDEVDAVRRRTSGRLLVVEYPIPAESVAGRAWLLGNSWPRGRIAPNGLPAPALPLYRDMGDVPGLVPARNLAQLALGQPEPRWLDDPGARWTGADRWLGFVGQVGPWVRGLLGVAAMLLAVWGLRLVADERRSRAYAYALSALFLAIPAVVMAGGLARVGGVGAWPVWFVAAALTLVGVGYGLKGGAERALPGVHPHWAVAGLSVLMLALAEPTYSAFSGPLGTLPRAIPPEPLGALLAALVVLIGGARSEPVAGWLGRGLALALALLGLLAGAWWSLGQPLLSVLPLGAWLAGTGRLRLWMIPLGWLASEGLTNALTHGVAYRAGGLIGALPERDALDLAPLVRFVFSPAFLVGGLFLVACAVFTPAFAGHQLRRAWRHSSVTRGLAVYAAALAGLGVMQPPLLDASYVVGVGAGLFLLGEAVWTSPSLS